MDQTPRKLFKGMVEASKSSPKQLFKKFPQRPTLPEPEILVKIEDPKQDITLKPEIIQEEIVIVKNAPRTRVNTKKGLNWYECLMIFVNIALFLGVIYTLGVFLRAILFIRSREIAQFLSEMSNYWDNPTSFDITALLMYEVDLTPYVHAIEHNFLLFQVFLETEYANFLQLFQ